MKQNIISMDSQILSSIQACALKTKYAFLDHITPIEKAEPLERGDALHKMLEFYYGMVGKCLNPKSDLFEAINELKIDYTLPMEREDIVRTAIKIGYFFASHMNLAAEEMEDVVFQFKEYCDHFRHDSWNPLAVEEVGSRILHEDEQWKILYNFKVDMVAEQGNLILPWDHKSSKKREDPKSMSNQFMGYCFGLDMTTIMVNKIGFQKTLSPRERFQRQMVKYDSARIEEWRVNTIWWAKELHTRLDTASWPMNLHSCAGKYGNCTFYDLCEATPSNRERVFQNEYKIGPKWDVSQLLVEDGNGKG